MTGIVATKVALVLSSGFNSPNIPKSLELLVSGAKKVGAIEIKATHITVLSELLHNL